jgi:hypothetical protein
VKSVACPPWRVIRGFSQKKEKSLDFFPRSLGSPLTALAVAIPRRETNTEVGESFGQQPAPLEQPAGLGSGEASTAGDESGQSAGTSNRIFQEIHGDESVRSGTGVDG